MIQRIWADSRRRSSATRKLRLFACACARRIWRLLDEPGRALVCLAEKLADAPEDDPRREMAVRLGMEYGEKLGPRPDPLPGFIGRVAWATVLRDPIEAACRTCTEAVWATAWNENADAEQIPTRAAEIEQRAQAAILADLFADHERPPAAAPWLRRNDGAVFSLACIIAEENVFALMPVLGDALEDAGCFDESILAHCRGNGPHVRGCWVLEMLLAGLFESREPLLR